MSGVRSGLKLLTRKPKAPKVGTGELGKVSEARSSSSDTSPPPPKPPFFYRARGIFGALLSLNLFVAGYMLFKGPSKRHKEGEEHNERGDVLVQSSSNRHDRQQNHSRDNLIPLKTENTQKMDDVQKSEDLQTTENKQSVEKAIPPPEEVPAAVMETVTETVTETPVVEEATQEGVVKEVVDTFLPSNTSHSFEVSKPSVSVEQQKEILKWILAEKRKLKPSSSEEKKKIDSEKRLLKDFLRAKSFPTLT